MANKIVKYQLDNGTIPTWIEDGGYYPDPTEIMIGATVDGSSETGLGELVNEAAIKSYLNSYASDWKDIDDNGNEIDFDIDAAVERMWNKKID